MVISKAKDAVGTFLIGVDDAGRGPVIGPMVLAGCLITPDLEKELKELGVTDSKLLTRKKREQLVGLIKEKSIAHHAHAITPSEIDTGMGIGLNLNEVEALATGIVINNLIEQVKKECKKIKIIVDCPSTNLVSWKECLMGYVEHKDNDVELDVECSHKADLKYPIVSAASIIAKVTRDAKIEELKKKIGLDFGSGYPADPKTRKFLAKYVNDEKIKKARIFRESWSTWRKAKEGLSQRKLPDY